jgi:hypothetical protein
LYAAHDPEHELVVAAAHRAFLIEAQPRLVQQSSLERRTQRHVEATLLFGSEVSATGTGAQVFHQRA